MADDDAWSTPLKALGKIKGTATSSAHSDDRQSMASIGIARMKSGILETVQYRRNPTFLYFILVARFAVLDSHPNVPVMSLNVAIDTRDKPLTPRT